MTRIVVGLLGLAGVAGAAPTYRVECNCPWRPGTEAVTCAPTLTFDAARNVATDCKCYYDSDPPPLIGNGFYYSCSDGYAGDEETHYDCQAILEYDRWAKGTGYCNPVPGPQPECTYPTPEW